MLIVLQTRTFWRPLVKWIVASSTVVILNKMFLGSSELVLSYYGFHRILGSVLVLKIIPSFETRQEGCIAPVLLKAVQRPTAYDHRRESAGLIRNHG